MKLDAIVSWYGKTTQTRLELRDRIPTTDSLGEEVWPGVFALYVLCLLTGDPGLQTAARGLLEAYFDAHPGSEASPYEPLAQRILGSIWKRAGAAAKPGNVPWDVVGLDMDSTSDPAEFSIDNPAFFQLGRWTETADAISPELNLRIGPQIADGTFDLHQWKTSEEPEVLSICARLLCRVPEGQFADAASVNEALEAVDRLYMQLSTPSTTFYFLFPWKIYFSLAVGLGKFARARDIFRLAFTWGPGAVQDILSIPSLYDVYLGDLAAAEPIAEQERLIGESDAASAIASLTEALLRRKQEGRQEPLHGVAWPELLRRFSEAAFVVYSDEYAEIEVDPPQRPSDILLPPITPEKLAEVERKLGQSLPDDLREMAMHANGFKGAWHLFGGGFSGVDQMEAYPSGDYEMNLGIDPMPTRVETRTVALPGGGTKTTTCNIYEVGLGSREGLGAGDVWVSPGTVENDDFEHVICPPETWRKLVERGRPSRHSDGVTGGSDNNQYRVTYCAHWSDGGDDGYTSMRDWIASETAAMERVMERRLELEGESGEDGGDD